MSLRPRLVVESVRWLLAEILRIFVNSNLDVVVAAIQELSRFPHPLIRKFGGQLLIQSITLTAEEEVLVQLLHRRAGMTTPQLVRVIPKGASGVRKAIRGLAHGGARELVRVKDHWEITDLGIVRIEGRILKANQKR